MDISVIGCGRWGAFVAWYLKKMNHEVTLFGRKGSRRLEELKRTGKNEYIALNGVTLTDDIRDIHSDIIAISIDSQNLRELITQLSQNGFNNKTYLLCMKGIEQGTGSRLTQIVSECAPGCKSAIWVGPGHVEEFAQNIPNCMVIDSEDERIKDMLIKQLSSELIRFYYGSDLIGNEIGAASKNVIGIAAGLLDGLKVSSLKGALMSRGTREIARLIKAMGGHEMTAYGLAHLGDYEATMFSKNSHNRKYGELFAQGKEYEHLAEGVYTAKSLMMLSEKYGVELPICRAVYDVIHCGKEPKETLSNLFLRSLKKEF